MTQSIAMLGLGIYYPAEGARFLSVPAGSLRRWARGYTFWTPGRERHSSKPVTRPDLPVIRGQRALSFLELMELRVVATLRRKGLSLQQIREAARIARQVLNTKHPFASRRIFTDRKRLFAYLEEPPAEFAMVELHPRAFRQLLAGPLLEPLLEDLDFDHESGVARRWWPLGKQRPVVLDPAVSFGAPTISGTRVRTEIVAGMAAADSAEAIRAAFDLSEPQIQAAITFEHQLRAA